MDGRGRGRRLGGFEGIEGGRWVGGWIPCPAAMTYPTSHPATVINEGDACRDGPASPVAVSGAHGHTGAIRDLRPPVWPEPASVFWELPAFWEGVRRQDRRGWLPAGGDCRRAPLR